MALKKSSQASRRPLCLIISSYSFGFGGSTFFFRTSKSQMNYLSASLLNSFQDWGLKQLHFQCFCLSIYHQLNFCRSCCFYLWIYRLTFLFHSFPSLTFSFCRSFLQGPFHLVFCLFNCSFLSHLFEAIYFFPLHLWRPLLPFHLLYLLDPFGPLPLFYPFLLAVFCHFLVIIFQQIYYFCPWDFLSELPFDFCLSNFPQDLFCCLQICLVLYLSRSICYLFYYPFHSYLFCLLIYYPSPLQHSYLFTKTWCSYSFRVFTFHFFLVIIFQAGPQSSICYQSFNCLNIMTQTFFSFFDDRLLLFGLYLFWWHDSIKYNEDLNKNIISCISCTSEVDDSNFQKAIIFLSQMIKIVSFIVYANIINVELISLM